MKHTLQTAAIVAALTGSLVLPTTASAAADFDWYGSVRAGAVMSDADVMGQDASWDLGGTGSDGTVGGQGVYSRIGIRASNDLGSGMTVGAHIERRIGGSDLSIRHTNIYLEGGFGRVTLGQQDNPYRAAAHWDQSWFLGGQVRTDSGSRIEGIKYSGGSGPLNYAVMVTGNDAADDGTGVANTAGEATFDKLIGIVGYDVGPVKVTVGVDNTNTAETGYNNTVVGVNGSQAGFSWYAAYETSTDNSTNKADKTSFGGFVGYGISEGNTVYAYYVSHDFDEAGTGGKAGQSPVETILGYSRSLGSGATFIAEYLSADDGITGSAGKTPTTLNLMFKIDF